MEGGHYGADQDHIVSSRNLPLGASCRNLHGPTVSSVGTKGGPKNSWVELELYSMRLAKSGARFDAEAQQKSIIGRTSRLSS